MRTLEHIVVVVAEWPQPSWRTHDGIPNPDMDLADSASSRDGSRQCAHALMRSLASVREQNAAVHRTLSNLTRT